MASQLYRVTGASDRGRNQVAALNARQRYLPQLLANQQRAMELTRQKELDQEQQRQFRSSFNLQRRGQNAQQRMAKQQLAQSETESRVGMGLEGVKLGSTIAQRYGGGSSKTFGSLFGGGRPSGAGGIGGATTHKAPGFFSNMNIGAAVGSGLAGFGAAKMFGGGKKKPIKKAAFGAAAGGLLGLLGGGKSGGISGAFSGGIGGLGASLF